MSDLHAFKRVVKKDAKGVATESLVEFTKILPGEEVVYVVKTSNPGTQAVGDVSVTLPIPKEMTYVAGTAERSGTTVTFSVDSGAHFAPLDKLVITAPDGASRPAQLTDITHVRWVIAEAIAPGGSTAVQCRATLK